MNCPHCSRELTISHLRDNPECDSYIKSIWAIRSRSKKAEKRRKRCPRCGDLFGVVAMRKHDCAGRHSVRAGSDIAACDVSGEAR